MKTNGEHRRHVLHDPLLPLDKACGNDHGTRGARERHPLDDPLGVRGTRGFEDERRQRQEYAATERDQHVVDEPLAGEADEVHAALV